jgi:hypothetical protein
MSGDVAVIADLGSKSLHVFRGLADCNENDALDICDITSGASEDCNGNGFPDDCSPAPGILGESCWGQILISPHPSPL